MTAYERIRKGMRENEAMALANLRHNGGRDPLIMSLSQSKAYRRLQDAGMIRWNRRTYRWVVRAYARPVTSAR